MRIVFLNPTGQIGGAERSLLDFMKSLRDAQAAWHLHLVTGEDGPLVAAAEKIPVTSRALPLPAELASLGDAGAGGPAGQELFKAIVVGRLALASVAAARYARNLRRVLAELRPDMI